MANETTISSTTQAFLDIYDITNDILILKDGSTALILTVNAMNFGLLAEEEQDAIIYSYAGLLNSLNYPIQIVIRSQTKDVTNYLQLLKDEEDQASTDVKRNWIRRYREFVADLIQERNVLDKKFYVVLPASALEMGLLPPSTVLPGVKQPDLSTIERSVILEKAKEILEPKRDHILAQFGRIGLLARQLSTQEIIQLFYVSYNPEAAEGQQITDTNSYTTPLVNASVQGGFMIDQTANATGPLATPVAPVTPAAAPLSPVPPAPAEPMTAPSLSPAPAQSPAPSAAPTMPAMPTFAEQAAITPPAAPMAEAAPLPAASAAGPAPVDPMQQEINSTLSQIPGATVPADVSTTAPTTAAAAATNNGGVLPEI